RTMEREALIDAMLKQQAKVDKYPVVGVTWSDADKFCRWRGGRLPTEKEWEKAARGEKGNEFPWGDNWDPKLTNTGDDAEWEEGIAPIGSYTSNASPYGIYDLSGNVWEWVSDWYKAIPGSDYNDPQYGEKNKVIKGGSGGMGHYAISYFYRNATRQYAEPNTIAEDIGFRCVQDI
ncbi:MAG: SUMF1/EgtB/PvdO family nonheme iron enzyme, partial [Gammaproteobacteria bacterium]|nr:SUMF1/EgtB/PvdO family nonheme iron enzyme [Gammaproteobacteria bacterium]